MIRTVFVYLYILIFLLLASPSSAGTNSYINDLPPNLPENIRNSMVIQSRSNLETNPIKSQGVSIQTIALTVFIGSVFIGSLFAYHYYQQRKELPFDPQKYTYE